MKKITTQFYEIYYRKTNKYLFENGSSNDGFIRIKNPAFKWSADPFLFEKDGKQYLFAEVANFFNSKGNIMCLCLNDKKPKWKTAIKNKYHMSFPNIFEKGKEIYMIPETCKDNCVALYKCLDFPYKWEKCKVLLNEPYTDSGLIHELNILYSYDDKNFVLHFYKMENDKISLIKSIDDPEQMLRPAGNCFKEGNKYIIPFQDNHIRYAGGVIFREIIIKDNDILVSDPILNFTIESAKQALSKSKIFGTHTYNKIKNFEVIDIVSSKFTFIGLLGKIRTKLLKL